MTNEVLAAGVANRASGFRHDINGLRAWAVLMVVLYHFGVVGVNGGFVGVDVFFVISGYLMCGIIVSGLDTQRFSLWHFYVARARRIFPALIVLCLLLLVAGWFFLMVEEYRTLGQHVRETLLFRSNSQYAGEAGYFDVASEEKWLLHTWSLSVEWQFYLVLPLILILLARFLPGHKAAAIALSVLLLLSLSVCLYSASHDPAEAFYLLPNRAWEMLAGALVYLLAPRKDTPVWLRRSLEWLGFALVLLAVGLLSKHSVWPSVWTLLPVVGTVFILLAERNDSWLTRNNLAQWLGSRSYSIYLWHWPLVVALVYVGRQDEWLWVWLAIAASLFLGHLSYRWVEQSSAAFLQRQSVRVAACYLIGTLLVVAIAAQVVRRDGFVERLPEKLQQIEAERSNTNPRMKECFGPDSQCVYGQLPVRAILIGDSHADAIVTALEEALGGQGGVLFRGESSCPIVFGVANNREDDDDCERLNNSLQRELLRNYAGVPVVMMGRTSERVNGGVPSDERPRFNFGQPYDSMTEEYIAQFRQGYIDTMCQIAQGRSLFLVRPTPEMAVDLPSRIARDIMLGQESSYALSLEDYHQRHRYVWAMQDEVVEQCGARILDPLPLLCDGHECTGMLSQRPLYRDDDHLSEYGNKVLVPMLEQVFRPQ